MTDILKMISIRGRFAFCLACLSNAMHQEQVDFHELSPALERMQAFLFSNQLDEWEKNVVEVSPDTIFDSNPDNNFNEYETISNDELVRLKSVYEKLPPALVKIIDLTISVGLSNLYGGTSEYSPLTLAPTLQVIEIMNDNRYKLPPLQKFSHYNFSDNNGWGFSQT